MLTYTTFFIASLIVAVVALFIYKAVRDTSRSVYSSKERIAIISHPPGNQGKNTASKTVAASKPFPDRHSSLAQTNMVAAYPAMPSERVDWGWEGNGNQLGEHHSHQTAASSHCSLYDVGTEDSTANHQQNKGFLQREDKRELGGRAYKVSRKAVPRSANAGTQGKPWGW